MADLAVLGAVAGEGMRRRLRLLTYRRGEAELSRPDPGKRQWVSAGTSLAFVALGWAFLPQQWPLLLLTAPVAAGAAWMSAIDLDVHRLPDAVALPLLAWSTIGVAVVSVLLPNVSFLSALAGAAALGGFLWILNLASAGALGFGDVKAGALVGLLTGALSLGQVWMLGMLTFLTALVAAIIPPRRKQIPLGPFLFGAWIVVTLAGAWP